MLWFITYRPSTFLIKIHTKKDLARLFIMSCSHYLINLELSLNMWLNLSHNLLLYMASQSSSSRCCSKHSNLLIYIFILSLCILKYLIAIILNSCNVMIIKWNLCGGQKYLVLKVNMISHVIKVFIIFCFFYIRFNLFMQLF